MQSSNATEERFNSTTSTEGRDLYFTEIISEIGEFSHLIDCHGVCGNNNEISFVTNLLVLHATKPIPIKCFVSHRPPSREGGSVGRAKKEGMNT